MNRRVAEVSLIVLLTLVCLGAAYGGISLLLNARGFGMKSQWLDGSPFADYQVPALALIVGVGGTSILGVAGTLWSHFDGLPAVSSGCVLIAFEIAEAVWFGAHSFQQPLMAVVGVVEVALGLYLMGPASSNRSNIGRRPAGSA